MDEVSNKLNDIPITEHFRLREFECSCCHCVRLYPQLVRRLEAVREQWGKPMIISSGYRCPPHNARVGGAARSLHMEGRAADVIVPFNEQAAVEVFARRAGFTQVIAYGKRNFMHFGLA